MKRKLPLIPGVSKNLMTLLQEIWQKLDEVLTTVIHFQLPDQAGHANEVLRTDGITAKWEGSGVAHYIAEVFPLACAKNFTPNGCVPAKGVEFSKEMFPSFWKDHLCPNADMTQDIPLPVFTSNTQDGFTVSDSRSDSKAYEYLNGVQTKAVGAWNTFSITIENTNGVVMALDKYTITASSNGSVDYPSAWQVQGWNGSAWVIVDQVGGQSFKAGESREFLIDKGSAVVRPTFSKYMINFVSGVVSEGNGSLGKVGFHFIKEEGVAIPITFEEYQKELDEKGFCARYAVDYVRGVWKTPTIPDGMIMGDWMPVYTREKNVPNPGTGYGVRIADAVIGSGSGGISWLGQNNSTVFASQSGVSASGRAQTWANLWADAKYSKDLNQRWFCQITNGTDNRESFDWSKWMESVMNKADKDLGNLTVVANHHIRQVTTININGEFTQFQDTTSYQVAPYDGYLLISLQGNNPTVYVYLKRGNKEIQLGTVELQDTWTCIEMQVLKGDSVRFSATSRSFGMDVQSGFYKAME